MAVLVHCDQCDKTEAAEYAEMRWFVVNTPWVNVVRFGSRPSDVNLCSATCVKEWIEGK